MRIWMWFLFLALQPAEAGPIYYDMVPPVLPTCVCTCQHRAPAMVCTYPDGKSPFRATP